jgi:uncharacterized sulfatase
MYPTTIGTHHMRCKGHLPPEVRCFPAYLREAGYYCTNNSKQDYQFRPAKDVWDESSRKAHWRNRKPGQPFFAVFNFTGTHESKIRSNSADWSKLDPKLRHDPAQAPVPPYYPDTPVVRRDRARYADNITAMDAKFQKLLDQLKADGLADDTIVWFWGDHGRGLPRAKRWIYDSGLHVPLILYVPEKWRSLAAPKNPEAVAPGTVNGDLVAFVDFAPTMLSLAGVPIPDHLQGQAFLGPKKAPPRAYIYAHRDRMDERYDLIRAARDKRFKYIRNYMPHMTRGQDIDYMNQMPTMKEMRRLFAEGKLKGAELQYFEPAKPLEELYDTEADPHEVHNLAGDPKYRDVLTRLRQAHLDWARETGDVGLIPEPIFDRLKQSDNWRADLTASGLLPRLRQLRSFDGQGEAAAPKYLAALSDPSPAMRYWAVTGLRFGVEKTATRKRAKEAVTPLLKDSSGSVRVAAALALCDWNAADKAVPVLADVLTNGSPNERLLAANALDQIGPLARPALPAIRAAQKDANHYVGRVVEATLRRLKKP